MAGRSVRAGHILRAAEVLYSDVGAILDEQGIAVRFAAGVESQTDADGVTLPLCRTICERDADSDYEVLMPRECQGEEAEKLVTEGDFSRSEQSELKQRDYAHDLSPLTPALPVRRAATKRRLRYATKRF